MTTSFSSTTSSFLEMRWTQEDSKAWRRLASGWKIAMRLGGRTPDQMIHLAMLSVILPAPTNPSFYVSVGMGTASMAAMRRRIVAKSSDSVCLDWGFRVTEERGEAGVYHSISL
ncbi:hypothetical protein ACFX2J_018470 [Malus domestica]